jgi:hypothetical protein
VHLKDFIGVLHADGFAGFNDIYRARGPDGAARVLEAACWAHVRRKFFDLAAAGPAPIAEEALRRIAELYAVEARIRGAPPDERRHVRASHALPKVEALKLRLETDLARVPAKGAVAQAIRYALSRWPALFRYLDDGRVEIDNNAAERAIRPVATRRSLYPSSSSIWKHGELVLRIVPTRPSFRVHSRDDGLIFKIGSADLIRCTGDDLLRRKDALPDEPADGVMGHAELRRGLGHGEPLAVLLGGAVGVHAVDLPDRADAVGRPGLSLSRADAHPVERGGDVGVRPAARHPRHDRERFLRRPAAMLAGLRLADAELSVLAAAPVDG